MKKHKRPFKIYEELALDIATVIQILHWMTHLYCRAGFTDKVLKIIWKLEVMKTGLEDEMYTDYPDKANENIFNDFGAYSLDIRKYPDYIFSSFGKRTCKQCDAFIVLTKQGVVLASTDAKFTPAEDAALYELNKRLMERRETEWEQ